MEYKIALARFTVWETAPSRLLKTLFVSVCVCVCVCVFLLATLVSTHTRSRHALTCVTALRVKTLMLDSRWDKLQ